ncbi:MAG: M14 family metallopeptidase [Acidobacteriota bacterium]
MKRQIFGLAVLVLFGLGVGLQAVELSFDRYLTPGDMEKALRDLVKNNPAVSSLHSLGRSFGGRDLLLLEIGPETGSAKKSLPAVFVAADMEGTVPPAGLAALYLAQTLIDTPEKRKDRTWYILPSGNPDAAARYFARPLEVNPRNSRPHNDDMDEAADEDGPDDLDGDGVITQMRVQDPQGTWMPVPDEPRLMKKADPAKGEKGIYKLYPEGLDNDGDGRFNEDGPGGVNVGINFPHLFKFFTPTGGKWAGSESESFALLKFFSEHGEIGLVFTFGSTNFCLVPPRGGRRGEVDLQSLRIPRRYAEMLNADPDKTYSMAEVIEMVRPMVPAGMDVDESMVAGFLGLGAAVNPLKEDLKFYEELSKQYKEFLKKNGLDGKRLEPAAAADGSFELWAYYHLGLPSFSLDFWTLPEPEEKKKAQPEITAEQLEAMSAEEFIALGEEKIDRFLKDSGAPADFKPAMVIGVLKSGQMTTKRLAEMIKSGPKSKEGEGVDPKEKALLNFSDTQLEGKGFVDWKPFSHPILGQVEIGGPVPFAVSTPPVRMIKNLLAGQVPWVLTVADQMARINIHKTEVKPEGAGVFRIKVWIENAAYLPYPTAMGKRNQRIFPVMLILEGDAVHFLEGHERAFIPDVGGLEKRSVEWLVRVEKPATLRLTVRTDMAWGDKTEIRVGGDK